MRSDSFGNYIGLYLAAFLLLLGGVVGLYQLIMFQIPTIGPRWLFFVVLVMAVTGVVVPFVHYLNRRFSRSLPPANVLFRQSLWLGIYAAILAWLQLGRALAPLNALLILAGLVAIEVFLRLRERSRWTPAPPSTAPSGPPPTPNADDPA